MRHAETTDAAGKHVERAESHEDDRILAFLAMATWPPYDQVRLT
jgi:hypothetical protein